MSSYSANQYESAFKPQRLQNWCEPKHLKERPTAHEGHTLFIANDRGHLLPGVVKRGSAWPDFKGTWDLPARIPVHRINPTGRSVEGLTRLKSWGFDPLHTGKSQPHSGSKNTDRLQDVGEQLQAMQLHPDTACRIMDYLTGRSQYARVDGCASKDSESFITWCNNISKTKKLVVDCQTNRRPPTSGDVQQEDAAPSEKAASPDTASSSKQRHTDGQEDQ